MSRKHYIVAWLLVYAFGLGINFLGIERIVQREEAYLLRTREESSKSEEQFNSLMASAKRMGRILFTTTAAAVTAICGVGLYVTLRHLSDRTAPRGTLAVGSGDSQEQENGSAGN